MSDWKTCVRLKKIPNLQTLASLQSHGLRLDPSAKSRVDASRTVRNVAFSPYCPTAPLNLVKAWRTAKDALGASCYGSGAIAAHLLVIISPGCVDAAGDRYDPANPANVALMREAADWAEAVFGAGSVVAGRLDLDEAGAGVVDLFVMPVRERAMNGRSRKKIISVASALDELQQAYGTETAFHALQTSWWKHASAKVDPRLTRGTPKEETDRRHVHADVYRAVARTVEPAARAEIEKGIAVEVEARLAALAILEAQAQAATAALARKEMEAQALAEELARRQTEIDAAISAHAVHREKLRMAAADINRRAQVATRDAITATRTGILSMLDGRIDWVPADEPGGGSAVFSVEMAASDRRMLREALRPGWRIGLRDILARLHELGVRQGGYELPTPGGRGM